MYSSYYDVGRRHPSVLSLVKGLDYACNASMGLSQPDLALHTVAAITRSSPSLVAAHLVQAALSLSLSLSFSHTHAHVHALVHAPDLATGVQGSAPCTAHGQERHVPPEAQANVVVRRHGLGPHRGHHDRRGQLMDRLADHCLPVCYCLLCLRAVSFACVTWTVFTL